MRFEHQGETYRATAGCSLLSGYAQANMHFGRRLPTPGAWMETAPDRDGELTFRRFRWTEGNFCD